MKLEELLTEVEDLIRTVPLLGDLCSNSEVGFSWIGRLLAVVTAWNQAKTIPLELAIGFIQTGRGHAVETNYLGMMTILHQARHDLRMKTVGPLNVAVDSDAVFDYFDEVRKTCESAGTDLLFVDPYLDAEFVTRYLVHVHPQVTIRLLTEKKLKTLLPAVEAFVTQQQVKVEVRSATGFHDRYVFVDRSSCYQSGASFKDGAKRSPTTLTQIVDAFQAIWVTYETIWEGATVESTS